MQRQLITLFGAFLLCLVVLSLIGFFLPSDPRLEASLVLESKGALAHFDQKRAFAFVEPLQRWSYCTRYSIPKRAQKYAVIRLLGPKSQVKIAKGAGVDLQLKGKSAAKLRFVKVEAPKAIAYKVAYGTSGITADGTLEVQQLQGGVRYTMTEIVHLPSNPMMRWMSVLFMRKSNQQRLERWLKALERSIKNPPKQTRAPKRATPKPRQAPKARKPAPKAPRSSPRPRPTQPPAKAPAKAAPKAPAKAAPKAPAKAAPKAPAKAAPKAPARRATPSKG